MLWMLALFFIAVAGLFSVLRRMQIKPVAQTAYYRSAAELEAEKHALLTQAAARDALFGPAWRNKTD